PRREGFFRGALSGVEGWVEAIAAGLLAGRHAVLVAEGRTPVAPSRETALGSLAHYISAADSRNYQPANIPFDLLPALLDGQASQACFGGVAPLGPALRVPGAASGRPDRRMWPGGAAPHSCDCQAAAIPDKKTRRGLQCQRPPGAWEGYCAQSEALCGWGVGAAVSPFSGGARAG